MGKPLGLKIISWWFVIGGLLSVVVMLIMTPSLVKEAGLSTTDIVISALVSTLIFISGIGLLRGKKWAWYTGVIIESLSLLYQLISIPGVAKKGLTTQQIAAIAVGLIVYGIIITYLLRQDVRELYGVSKPSTPDTGADVQK
jgi:hypothetical protein